MTDNHNVFTETITEIEHYTNRLFRFRTTRPNALRFRSGEFVMIGLPTQSQKQKTTYRAYSIASPAWDETLEFYSIKVPNGPLTQYLQKIQKGDTILIRKKPTGTLVLDALLPGKTLWMIATGTGFAPFASILRDPEAYEKFDQIIATHTCRERAEATYSINTVQAAKTCPLVGSLAAERLRLLTSTTREQNPLEGGLMGRITALMDSGSLYEMLKRGPLAPAHDRVMLCGSMAMLHDLKARLEAHGFSEGANSAPGHFVVERAFVD